MEFKYVILCHSNLTTNYFGRSCKFKFILALSICSNMRLIILVCLMSWSCGLRIKRQGTLASLGQTDKDNLVKMHNDFRAKQGASNMMKMVSDK